jgi:hypothetical protein
MCRSRPAGGSSAWKQDREQLVNQLLQNEIETIIVSCNEVMGEKF